MEIEILSEDIIILLKKFYETSCLSDIFALKDISQEFIHNFKLKIQAGLLDKNYSWCLGFDFFIKNIPPKTILVNLDNLISSSLILIDDFNAEFILIGLRTMNRILENSSTVELIELKYANVIYDALKKKTHIKDLIIIQNLYPTLKNVLEILEQRPCKKPGLRQANLWDEVFYKIIINANLETRLQEKLAFVKALVLFLPPLGITAGRHSEGIFQLLMELFQIGNSRPVTVALELLLKFIEEAPYCVRHRRNCMFKQINILLYNITVKTFFFDIKDRIEIFEKLVGILLFIGEDMDFQRIINLNINKEFSDVFLMCLNSS